jgi:hypothetical protein
MIAALCWGLIHFARALEWLRLHWGDVVLESRLAHWTTRPLGPRSGVVLITWPGRILLAPFRPTHWLAVQMTRLANRGLPPLGEDEGFLARLYPRPP